MTANIIIPHVGETTSRVVITRWLKEVGDPVTKGDPLLEVETDKVTLTIEAYTSGVLEQIVVGDGEEADAMQVVGVIRAEGEVVPLNNPQPVPQAEAPRAEAEEVPAPADRPKSAAGRANVSPLARRMAAAHGIDLSGVAGSGPDGLVTADDVRALIEAKDQAAPPAPQSEPVPPAAPDGEGKPLSNMRQAIAALTVKSVSTIPHFYMGVQIRMKEALRLRESLLEAYEKRYQVRLSPNHLLIKALALAAQAVPAVNATYADGLVTRHRDVNVGLAVALEDGLVVPVLKRAQEKSLAEIARESASLVQRARSSGLTAEDYSSSTVTLSNLGKTEVDFFTAIIRPPEVMILAVGNIAPRPVVQNDRVLAEPTMYAVASADHRVIDGKVLAEFLTEFKHILENPYILLDRA